MNNRTISEETRAKLSKALKGRKKPEGFGKKLSNSIKGHPVSKETRDKLSKFFRGRKRKPFSKEHLLKLSIAAINRTGGVFKDTIIEKIIEKQLVLRNIKYVKQKALHSLRIADFYLPDNNTIIECDGCYWHGCQIHYPERIFVQEKDERVDSQLREKGLIVLRFWEHDIHDSMIITKALDILLDIYG